MNSALPDNKIVNILIVDDDEDDFIITSWHIKKIAPGYTFNIEWCADYDKAIVEMRKGDKDIYFIDFRLGVKTGLDLIKEAISFNCKEPMVLLTGVGNYEIDIQATEAGAVDFLVKSELTTEKMERCIRYSLSRYEFVKALQANEQKFRSIFERSKDCIFTATEQLVFKDANEAANTLLAYSINELQQLSLFDLLANKEDQNLIERELFMRGAVSDKEVDLLTKSGEKINCVISLSGEKDSAGNFYIQGIIHDITGLKKSVKTDLLNEKHRATERLARTLAHEVRNPLNNIYLSAEQLATEIKEGDSKIYLDIINRNSKRIGDLITELLNSSLPTEIILKKVSLQSVMDESIAAALDRISLKQIKLEKDFINEGAMVMADHEKLKIAILNIIINAIEAMKEAEGNLTVAIKNNGANYLVSITDNGTGISEEDITKLFEPYYTSKRNGMGLGLASTLNIIQSHKALIEVNSKLNQGTTF